MAKSDVALVAGVAGFLLGGAAVFVAMGLSPRVDSIANVQKSDNESFAGLGHRLDLVDNATKEVTRRLNGLDVNPKPLLERIRAIDERLALLEAAGAKSSGAAAAGAGTGAGGATKDGFDAAKFEELHKRVFAGGATSDEAAEFWAMLREKPEILAGWVKDAEKAVADSPRDKQAHRQLGEVYLAKLMTVPDGIEKGIWSSKMIKEEKAILEIDPDDWDARYSVATNYSFWPEQFNKRPDAIKEFETLRKVQENATPEPKHAQTYLQLRNLYLKDGRTADAKAALEEGARRFPNDEELKKALDAPK